MARSEMKRFPEPWMIEKASKPRWGYTHGLVVKLLGSQKSKLRRQHLLRLCQNLCGQSD